MPEQGFLQREVVSLNSWSSEDLRALGECALAVGSPQFQEQREETRNSSCLEGEMRIFQVSSYSTLCRQGFAIARLN